METYGSVSRLPGRAVGVVKLMAPNSKGLLGLPSPTFSQVRSRVTSPATYVWVSSPGSGQSGSGGTPGPPSLLPAKLLLGGRTPKRFDSGVGPRPHSTPKYPRILSSSPGGG